MEKGQIVEVKIEDMSSEGCGIGRAGGFVVFVPGAVAGDTVKVQLTKVKKNYGFSKLLELISESDDRTDEFDCEFFENGCGGCQYGKLRYGAQLALKERQVRQKLQRIAGISEPAVRRIIGMEEDDNGGFGPFRYRNKATFPVNTGGVITRKGGVVENLGEPAVGFFRAKSHEVVDCGDCYLQSMAAMAAADALRRFMYEDNITAWDPKWQKGLIRHLIVKTGFASGEVMVILVINGNGIPNIQKLVEMLDDAIYDVGFSLESVVLSIKKSEAAGAGNGKSKKRDKNNSQYAASGDGRRRGKEALKFNGGEIMGDKNVVVAGKPVIRDTIGDLEFEISPASFYQVNPVQMKRLYDKVKEYCGFSCAGNGRVELEEDAECENRAFEAGADSKDVEVGSFDDCRDSNRHAEALELGSMRDERFAEKKPLDDKKPVVLDLYCGVGSIGLYCAESAEFVIGIEAVNDAVIDANRNAVINGIVNARYICGKAEEVLTAYASYETDGSKSGGGEDRYRGIDNAAINSSAAVTMINEKTAESEKQKDSGTSDGIAAAEACGTSKHSDGGSKPTRKIDLQRNETESNGGATVDPELAELIKRADVAIIDPPRAGCKPELLEAVATVGVDRIVYVSCDPATLARDVKILGELGYEFLEATPVDMFPWTGHVETVVLMSKVNLDK